MGDCHIDSILKSKDITLPTMVHLVKAMVFPVVRYGCESWTVTQGTRLSGRDQEGRRGSEEAVPGPSVFPSGEPGVWRLNNTLLNNQQITEEIKKEIKICIEMDENENTTTQNLWDQPSPWVGPGKPNLPLGFRGRAGGCARVTAGPKRPHLSVCPYLSICTGS